MRTTYDYSRLRGKIKEKCGTESKFAELMGMCRVSLSKRLNNMLEFSQGEMIRACKILEIDFSLIHLYFFCPQGLKN